MNLNGSIPTGGSSTAPAALTTLADQSPKDRQSLFWIVIACGGGIVGILISYVLGAMPQWDEGYVAVALRQVEGVAVTQPSAITLTPTGTLAATVAVDALATPAVVLLWLADGLQAVLWCAVVVLLGLLARNIAVGRLFAPTTLRLLSWFTIAVFVVVVVPQSLRHLGTNWVIGTLGWGDQAVSPDSGAPIWVAYFAILFCLCMQIALRSGARLARDQDGIV